MDGKKRYQLRKAAGVYWLVDMEQSGAERQGQIMLNESGAHIWERYEHLHTMEAVAEELSREFGIPVEQGLADIGQFFRQLEKQGLVLQ